MSLPNSEPLPNDINDLPPARQRHIRRLPRSATPSERQILLNSLVELTSPTLNYFLFILIGTLALGAALYFNDPALLLTAVIALQFFRPVLGLGLLPTSLKMGSGLKSAISLLIPIALAVVSGGLAGWLQKEGSLGHLGLFRFAAPYWLDLIIVGGSTLLGALILLRQGRLPQLIGVLLSYEILVPLAAGSFGFILGDIRLWPGAVLTGLLHLGLAIAAAIFAFLLLGFFPKKTPGWLMTLVPLSLILAVLMLGMNLGINEISISLGSSPTPTFIIIPSQSPSPRVSASFTATTIPWTLTATQTPSQSPTPTMTLTQTHTLTQTPTPEPTTYWGFVGSLTGAVIRELPDFEAEVITYANDGDFIEILDETMGEDSTRWFKVRTNSGVIGWLLSSLVNTPTPTVTP